MKRRVRVPCLCPTVEHGASCPMKLVVEERGRLYHGLYDGHCERRLVRAGSVVRLLNPDLIVGDATSRRFALLEID